MLTGPKRAPAAAASDEPTTTLVRTEQVPPGFYEFVATPLDAIAGAADIEALAHAAALIRRHAAELLAEGMATETLCQQVSALNDLVSLQAIDLVAANFELPYVPWCWLALPL